MILVGAHLVAFFDWLLKQDGYRRLPGDFAGYLKLPKSVVARASSCMYEAERTDIGITSNLLKKDFVRRFVRYTIAQKWDRTMIFS